MNPLTTESTSGWHKDISEVPPGLGRISSSGVTSSVAKAVAAVQTPPLRDSYAEYYSRGAARQQISWTARLLATIAIDSFFFNVAVIFLLK